MTTQTYIRSCAEGAAKATEGPWRSKTNHAPYKCVWIDKREQYCTLELKPQDADFIASARTAVPVLAAMLEKAVAALKRIGSGQARYYGSEANNALTDIEAMVPKKQPKGLEPETTI